MKTFFTLGVLFSSIISITFVVWVTEETTWENAQKIEVNDFHIALRDLEPGKKYRAAVTMRDRDGFHSTFSEIVMLEPLPGTFHTFLSYVYVLCVEFCSV